MTVSTTTSRVEYSGNGATTQFSVPFYFLANGDLKVYQAGTLKTITTHYSVSGAGDSNGGTVTFVTAPASGDEVVIFRDPAITQVVDYVPNDDFPAETHEEALDRLTMIAQRNRDLLTRSVRLPDDEAGEPSLEVPALATRANKTFYWNAAGEPSVADVSAETITFSPEIQLFSGDGTTTQFTITEDPGTSAALVVAIDGVLQKPDTDFTVGGTTLTFTSAPPSGSSNIAVQNFGIARGVNSVNASGVAYTPGGTNAVATNVQSVLRARFVNVSDFGSDLDAVQDAIDYCYTLGGGSVECTRGATYTGTTLPVLKEGVILEMNRATFEATLGSGSVYGLRMANYSAVRNGTIEVTSTGSPSSQFIFHTCISIGEANSNGGTPASPSTLSTVRDWLIEDMTLSTGRQYCPVIQGAGNIYNGVIRNIRIPDSSTCSGVHLDWSDIGSPVSSANISGTRTAFDAGDCYTTHPHNILIENIKAGNLSVTPAGDLGSSIVRLSACYNITVRNIECVSVTLAAYLHVGGDLGFEFAPSNVKQYACKGNSVEKVTVLSPSAVMQYGIYIDTLADNIYREQFLAAAYSPLMNPLMHGDVVVRDANLNGNLTSGKYGIRITQARGVRVLGGSSMRWDYGAWVDEFAQDVDIDGLVVFGCRTDGIVIGFDAVREDTERVGVRHCKIYGNGVSSTGYGINVKRCRTAKLFNNYLGTTDEATQAIGIVIIENGLNYDINGRDNHVLGATTAAYSLPASTGPYFHDRMGSWDNNSCELSVPQAPMLAPQNTIPLRKIFTANRIAKEYTNTDSGDPTTGHWKRGSLLWQKEATSGASVCKSVTTSGSFGTLSGLTNASTTNTSKDVTMSLAARTATATAGSYSATVSSATDLRVGLLCSITGGVTNARILAISGTTIQLNKQCKAVTGAAFTTAGVVEGEVVSLNTTTPIAGAVVMKVNGSTVTLDTAASDTQSGRTVSYTTPVFKAHAAIA